MKFSEDIRPVSYLKSRTADILAQVNETHRAIIITQNGEPRGVLQDTQSYERMKTAIGLMKLLAQGEEDIRHGRSSDQDEVFSRLNKRLESKKRQFVNEP